MDTSVPYERKRMEHLGTVTLETDRLILRRFAVEDAAVMYRNWANDPEVTKFLMWQPHANVDETIRILTDWAGHYEEKDWYLWAIVRKENGDEPVGSISIVQKDDHIAMVQFGYCIGQKWWHQGIMSEALAAMMRFFFEEVGVNRIEAHHDPANPNSGKVMMKCGMRREGLRRAASWNNQGICDSAIYGILAEDYAAMNG